MLTYILVTLTILIVIISAVMFYGYRQMNQLTMGVQRNMADISAMKHLLEGGAPPPTFRPRNPDFPFPEEEDASDDEQSAGGEPSYPDDEPLDDVEQMLDDMEDHQSTGEAETEPEVMSDTMGDTMGETMDEGELVTEGEGEPEAKIVEVTTSSPGGSKKKTPNEPAKNFEVGYTLLSTNDNNLYEVISTKSGSMRWKKVTA